MRNFANVPRPVSITLYVIGLLLVLAAAVMTIWPDLEASLFDSSLSSEETLQTMRCPWVITPDEEANITLSFANELDRELNFLVRARISSGSALLMREIDGTVELAPGESEVLSLPIGAEDAAYGRMVLARVFIPRRGEAVPSQQQACGILVMALPLRTGNQFLALLVVTGLVSLAAGLYLWLQAERPLVKQRRSRMIVFSLLALLVSGAMAAGLLGSWMIGSFLLVLAVILLAVIFEQLVIRS